MSRRCGPLLGLVLACMLLAGCGTNTTPSDTAAPTARGGATETSGGSPEAPVGSKNELPPPADPAPEFEVETFDGETFALAEHRGTPVVLNFWESW